MVVTHCAPVKSRRPGRAARLNVSRRASVVLNRTFAVKLRLNQCVTAASTQHLTMEVLFDHLECSKYNLPAKHHECPGAKPKI